MLAAIILLFNLSPFCQANVFERDERVSRALPAEDLLSGIGTLTNTSTTGRGTAFLVSRCLVLTNFHVGLGHDPAAFNSKQTSIFELPSGEKALAAPLAFGNFKLDSDSEDWALLKLENCLGDSFNFLPLKKMSSRELVLSKQPLIMAGFPSDKSTDKLTWDPLCFIRSFSWGHDCASRPGSSGSPILISQNEEASKPTYEVVAIHVKAHGDFAEIIRSYNESIGNTGIGVDGFYDRVAPFIAADQ